MSTKALKHEILTDVATRTYRESMTLGPAEVGGSASGYSVTKHTLRGGLSDGVDVVSVDNGTLSFDLLPTRGMSLWKAQLGELDIGWQSPVRGPVHPKFVPLMEPSGLGWLDGFDELLVRCGLESNGAPDFAANGQLIFPLHGRIGNRPAHQVDVVIDGDAGEIAVIGVVEETRLHGLKLQMTSTVTTQVGEQGFCIHDTIRNLSATPAEIQMLYHINFGPPFLEAGARFIAPVKTVVPRTTWAAEGIVTWDGYRGPTPGFEEQVYFLKLRAAEDGFTQALLKNAAGNRGVSLHFEQAQLPCFTLWKNTASLVDGYVTGLEPGVNFPNPRTFEGQQGRVVNLAPSGQVTFELQLKIHTTAAQVEQVEAAIVALQGGVEPEIHPTPQPGWCAP